MTEGVSTASGLFQIRLLRRKHFQKNLWLRVQRWSGWVRAGLPAGEDRGASGLGCGVVVAGAACPLGASLALGVGGFVDVEVQEFHW